ncbi:MAG: hypothetical protein KatS3mg118_2596 [Paracoccaceae bacterium]|nr:MAG: hypothetical protein KatS3mg118_2596 [Paracoccaceae bacterium]
MSDRIAVLRAGEVQQVGTPEDIYLRPDNRFVADFIGDTNFIEARVQPWCSRAPAELTSTAASGCARGSPTGSRPARR